MGVRWAVMRRSGVQNTLDDGLIAPARAGVALFGPAGVGKTVLARGAAERFGERHRDRPVHWVTATASAARIPFGAFSYLIDVAPGLDPTAVLAAARAVLCPPGRPALIVVDDAHLLDGYSATLLHQLATATEATVLLTCRVGEPVTDAVTALWKDDVVARVDVTPLTRAESTELVQRALGGSLAAESAERIFVLSQGNPLYLRHLVEGAEAYGSLVRVDGTWQWRGATVLTERLAELIDTTLTALPAGAHRVLEYLAIDEPLPVAVLTKLGGAESVEAAERAAAVRLTTRGEQLVAHPAHPLYTERLRAGLGQLAARRLRTELVRSVREAPGGNVSDRLRWMALAIDSDAPPDAADLMGAAWQAMFLGDFALTERLAAAALRGADTSAVRVVLAQALCWQGRGRDAEEVLDAVRSDELSDFELLYWALSKAANEFWMLRRAEQAAHWLTRVRERISEPAALLTVDGLASQFAMNLGQLDRCVELAEAVLAADGAQDLAVAWAASASALAYARMGRLERVEALNARCASVVHPDGIRFNAALGHVQAMLLDGRVGEARTVAAHHLAISEFRQPAHAQGQILVGQVQLARGDLPGAIESLTTAATHFGGSGIAWEPVSFIWLANALGQFGDAAGAAGALSRADEAQDAHTRIHDPELEQARAWTLAAAGDAAAARVVAHDAVAAALETGQLGIAVLAHHDAIRFGDTSALDELERLAAQIDCTFGHTVLAHGRALRSGDGAGLLGVSGQLESSGLLCAAADAAAQGAHAHALAEHRAEELTARATADRLRRACGDPVTPALAAVLKPAPLTNREREVAELVAAGKTNRSIAEHLTISVRTVEVHVYRACAKLNVPTRTQLAQTIVSRRRE